MPLKHVLHHLHKRKRVHQKLEPYPHPDKLKRFIDKAIFVVAIWIPLMTIPQVIRIWVNRSAQDVSIITWGSFLVSACFWLVYSVLHRDKPLIINSILWVILEALVVIGILIYG